MTTGVVNADLEAVLSLELVGTDGSQVQIEAVIDTGYNGFLTVPTSVVALLDLEWLGRDQRILADGQTTYFDVYRSVVLWEGAPRIIEVEATDVTPLIGTALLHRHEVKMQFIVGGDVTVTAIP